MIDEKPVRAFLAIEIPPEILNEIKIIQNRLRNTLQGMIRWVKPEAIHLTLKFFGALSAQEIAEISQVMEGHVMGIGPFSLEVKKLGVFPNMSRPRVLWFGISGDVDPLTGFQRAMDQKLYACGFEIEKRLFRPHLTLARIKEQKGVVGLTKIIEKGDYVTAGNFYARELILFRSELTPKGAIYTKLACFRFSG